jgi:hypothetical protein
VDTYTLNTRKGITNLKDHIFRGADKVISELQEALNVDIAEDGTWSLRPGRGATKYTGAPHSFDPKGSGLFVDASELKRVTSVLTTPYTTVTIATMSNDNDMVYENLPGRGIVCSNGVDIGIVNNDIFTPFPHPNEQYKRAMPAGQGLTYFNSTLYVSKGSEQYFSDPQAYGIIDTRNKKRRFRGYITLQIAVDDGMYISDSYDTFFYQGLTPHEYTVTQVADYPAIYGMSATVERRLVGDGSMQGTVVYWLSSKGVCMGTSGGKFFNLTIGKYGLSNIPYRGCAYFRNNNGIPQFIAEGTY